MALENTGPIKFPGMALSHRYSPAESPRTVIEPEDTKRLASEVVFNPVARVKLPGENVLVKPVTNSAPRPIKPVLSNGKILLPVRGERVFELGGDLHSQTENRLQTLTNDFRLPKKKVLQEELSPSSNSSEINQLLIDMAIMKNKLRQIMSQKKAFPEGSMPLKSSQKASLSGTTEAVAPRRPLGQQPEATKVAPPQSARERLSLARAQVLSLISELRFGHYRGSLLIDQMIFRLTKQESELFDLEIAFLTKTFTLLPEEMPLSPKPLLITKNTSNSDRISFLINWQKEFDRQISLYNQAISFLKQNSGKGPVSVSADTKALENLPSLAEKLIQAAPKSSPKALYRPINLPKAHRKAAEVKKETPKKPLEHKKITSQQEKVEREEKLIAAEVAKQLEKEKAKLEETLRQQLNESLPKTETAAEPAQKVEERAPKEKEDESPVREVVKEVVKPVVVEVRSAERSGDEDQVKQMLSQTESLVTNLSLDQLSEGERERLLGRLRTMENESEVMRQYDDLRYQKEKERLSAEIKSLVDEASRKAREAKEGKIAQENAAKQKLEEEAARKAKNATEVRELVEKEKARHSRTPNIVSAQPAFGKMIPPKVSFPNVMNGIVRDRQGLLLTNVVMIIKDTKGDPVRALKSNKIGQFITSTPLPNGTYTIELEKEGCDFDIVRVELTGGIMPPIEIRAL